ncbi:hypothetical protein [Gellertiella hungarica]|uniref:Uncharacterized protein n=1 Tax=Gellertiella hungarica TaxID=1572859 RepID=A0A7W6J2Q6_9HYPH|nr:hypothetical protein [Gellertiella hungarica]MBB4063642.1 hypothetical protein [Gellertiella hungarica]
MTATLRSTALFTLISALSLAAVLARAEAIQKRADIIDQEARITWSR